MRIIEPIKTIDGKPKRNLRKIIIFVVGVMAILVSLWLIFAKKRAPTSSKTYSQPTAASSQAASAEPEQAKPKQLRKLTGAEIKTFLDSFSYPNVSEIQDLPLITGNIEADKKIRQLAEARGYRQRAIPNTSLVKVDNYSLQQKAITSWQALKAAAARDGISLQLNEGFRSIDDQRQLFMARFSAAGGSASSVAAGNQDALVDKLLEVTAIPGYSKHHTGFTVDIACGNSGDVFERTPCFTWLSKDNYVNAKLAGWLPSYPEGAPAQGPNPEPWEYVWVGPDSLYE